MTTISHNRNRPSRSRLTLVLVGLCVLCALAAFIWREPFAGALWRVLGPVASVRTSLAASVGTLVEGFAPNASLAAENESLRAQLASTSVALMDRNLLYAENIELKARLNRPASSTRSVLASVIMRPPASPYDTLMLDVGSDASVRVGDLVSAGGSVYVGRIAQVYGQTSRATLFSTPGETLDALLTNPRTSTNTPLSLAGQGGASMVGEVPTGVDVSVGDPVILSNLGVELVAHVTAIDMGGEKSFKTVYVQLPVNPLSLRFVEVRLTQ
jgi:cell shape-determining protein MreC